MATAWINEFGYKDFSGVDLRDFVEIAATAGTDLTGWKLSLYHSGIGGAAHAVVYDTVSLAPGVLADTTGTGFGIASTHAGLQDSGPAGIALVDSDGNVVDFVSYEGTLTAANGPAAGMTSIDTNVFVLPTSTAPDPAVVREGIGIDGGAFGWSAEGAGSPGDVNFNQIIDFPGGSFTWIGSVSSEYGVRANWDPARVPGSNFLISGDSAVFTSNGAPTAVDIGTSANLDAFIFTAGAPAYAIHVTGGATVAFVGAGIVNNSAVVERLSIDAGSTVRLGSGATLGNTATTVDGSLVFSGSASAGTATITVSGGLDLSGGAAENAHIVLDGGVIDSTGLTVGSLEGHGSVHGAIGRSVITVGGLNTSTAFSGFLGLLGDLSLNKVGSGTFTFSGQSLYLGPTTVLAGTLQAGAANAFADRGLYIVQAGAVLDLDGFSQTIGALVDPNALGGLGPSGTVTSQAGGATLTIGSDNVTGLLPDMSASFSGTIADGSAPGMSLALTKIGAITQVLSGIDSYSGTTTINGGTLEIDGALTASATLVNDGGTLAGSGTVQSVFVASGGRVTPGRGIGALATGDFTLGAGGSLAVEIGGAQHDELHVTGAVHLAGTLAPNIVGAFDPPAGTTFTIIDNDGTDPVIGGFSGLAEGAVFQGGTSRYAISYKGGDGNDVVLTALSDTHITVQGSPDIVAVSSQVKLLLGDGAGGFGAPTVLQGGSFPSGVAVGDLNGDGAVDIVVTNLLDDTVRVLLGDATGHFADPIIIAVSADPHGVAIGDVNHDGHVDIVTANAFSSNAVDVLLGDGAGGFALQPAFAAGAQPMAVALGDLDLDGNLDIVTANTSGDTVSVLLGNGFGGLSAPRVFAVGAAPANVALGDLNRDGILDIVTANSGGADVSVLFGNGAGGFGPAQAVFDTLFPHFVALGDVNGDGALDVVTVNGSDIGGLQFNEGCVLLNDGSGSFAQQLFFFVGNVPTGLTLGDVNGDGHLDVITSDEVSGDVGVLLGDGTGSFLTSTTFSAGDTSGPVMLGDFDNAQVTAEDTLLIFGAAHHNAIALSSGNAGGSDQTLTLSVGSGTLRLATVTGLMLSGNGTAAVTLSGTIAEINAALDGLSYLPQQDFSGRDTLTVATQAGSTITGTKLVPIIVNPVDDAPVLAIEGTPDIATANLADSNVSVLLSHGAGSFADQASFAAGDFPNAAALADLNGDGILDIVTTNQFTASVNVLLGDGRGGFGLPASFAAGDTPVAVALGDVDGDGRLDIVLGSIGPSDSVRVLLGDGAGAFTAPLSLAAGDDPSAVALGDVNGDGRLDIVAANQNSDVVSVFLGNGAGAFVPQTTFATGPLPRSLALADVNHDGRLDIVTANEGGSVSVLLGTGVGGFAPQRIFAAGDHPTSVALGDLNGDGSLDVVTVNTNGNDVSVLLGDGVGGFAAQTTFAAGIVPFSLALADVNHDGHLDVVTVNVVSNTASILLGDGAGGFGAAIPLAVGTQPMSAVVGDLDNARVAGRNTSIVFDAAHGNAITLSDVDAGTGNETLTLSVASGTLMLAGAPGLAVDGSGTNAMTVTGTVAAINAALGGLSYLPGQDFTGRDTLAILANDNAGSGKSANLSIPLIVLDGPNPAPVALNGNASGPEDAALDGTVAASGAGPLSYELAGLNGGAAHGSVTLHADGSFTYTPAADFNGSDSFAFKVNDGTLDSNIATESVTITPVNDAPVAQDGTASADGVIHGTLLAHDIDSGSLAFSAVTRPEHGTLDLTVDGTFTYTPDRGFNGVDSFTFKVNDGALDSNAATQHLTVTVAPNQPSTPPASPPGETPHLVGSSGDDSFAAPTGSAIIEGRGGNDSIIFDFRLTDANISFSGNQVIVDAPNGTSHTVLTGFEIYKFTDGTVNENDADPLVDDLFYYARNHDVWLAHADADQHYHTFGWHEARDPDAFFSTSTYLSLYPDVKAAALDPLVHFDQFGWSEGRAPSIGFNDAAYLAAYPDVAAAAVDPLKHFLQAGAQEGRQPTPFDHLLAPDGFDFVYYLQHNPDVAAAHIDPLHHYETVGWKEGRNPNALFDVNGYLAAYGDVKAAGVNPLDHYDQFGWKEGRDPSSGFDTPDYLAHYPDVAATHVNPLVHFLQFGQAEGRSPFADGHFG